jgi:hypothetical protein
MDLKETGCEDMGCVQMDMNSVQRWAHVNTVM